MDKSFSFCIGKITNEKRLKVALQHNKREFDLETPSIDRSRSSYNYSLTPVRSVRESVMVFDDLMRDNDARPLRRNCVVAVEIVVSLSSNPTLKYDKFYKDVFIWVKDYYKVEILSFDVHRDEKKHHCHIILIPLVDGKMRGSDLVGNKLSILNARKSLHDNVASRYGMCLISDTSSYKANLDLYNRIVNVLENDCVIKSKFWRKLKSLIRKDPKTFSKLITN